MILLHNFLYQLGTRTTNSSMLSILIPGEDKGDERDKRHLE